MNMFTFKVDWGKIVDLKNEQVKFAHVGKLVPCM